MKTLGIVGGLGPESTLDYYRSLVARFRERVIDGSYPHIIVNSIDLKKIVDGVTAGDFARVADHLAEGVDLLARAGADFGLIAANTPHIVFDEVSRRSSIPLISIVQAACDAAKAADRKRLALFGTRFTMQGGFYPEVFSPAGIMIVQPEVNEQAWIHDKYMGELVNGILLPQTHAGLLAIMQRMQKMDNIDGVLLAGTELSLIIREEAHHGIPILDTARIHVESAVDEMLRP